MKYWPGVLLTSHHPDGDDQAEQGQAARQGQELVLRHQSHQAGFGPRYFPNISQFSFWGIYRVSVKYFSGTFPVIFLQRAQLIILFSVVVNVLIGEHPYWALRSWKLEWNYLKSNNGDLNFRAPALPYQLCARKLKIRSLDKDLISTSYIDPSRYIKRVVQTSVTSL